VPSDFSLNRPLRHGASWDVAGQQLRPRRLASVLRGYPTSAFHAPRVAPAPELDHDRSLRAAEGRCAHQKLDVPQPKDHSPTPLRCHWHPRVANGSLEPRANRPTISKNQTWRITCFQSAICRGLTLSFAANRLALWPPLRRYCDGFRTKRSISLKMGQGIDIRVVKSATLEAIGPGQTAKTNGFP